MVPMRLAFVVLAFALAMPAAASPLALDARVEAFDSFDDAGSGSTDPTGDLSCAVVTNSGPGSGVQPFVDPAAAGAQVGTDAGSVTLAVYPYSCAYVVLQLANPNQPLPREPLPEDGPLPDGFLPADATALLP